MVIHQPQPLGVPFNLFRSTQVRAVREQSRFAELAFASLDKLYVLGSEARLYVVPGDECAEDRNWREMLVGASSVVRRKSGQYAWPTGYNTKRTDKKNCPSKKCAEKRMFEKIQRMNLTDDPVDYVVAILTTGNFQHDDESGDEHDALDLCGACKRMCVRSKFTLPDTVVFIAQPPGEDGFPLYAEMRTIEYYDRKYVRTH